MVDSISHNNNMIQRIVSSLHDWSMLAFGWRLACLSVVASHLNHNINFMYGYGMDITKQHYS